MSGVGVELLVEPWELGPRKAKEFLLCADDARRRRGRARRARQPGRPARRAGRGRAARWPSKVALVPPITAEAVKDTINHMVDLHGPARALAVPLHGPPVREQHRRPRSAAPKRARPAAWTRCAPSKPASRPHRDRAAHRAAGPRSRHADRRAVLRRAARRAGRRGHQDRAARHAATSCARSARSSTDGDGAGYSLFWAVEGRGRKSVTLDLRTPEGQDLFRRLAATADVVVENFRPGTLERWNIAPGDLDPRLVTVRISHVRPGRPVLAAPGARPRRHRLRRAAPPHRLPRPAAGARRRDDLRLPHRRVRRPGRDRRALRTRRAPRRHGRGRSTPRSTARCCASSSGRIAAYDRLGIVRDRARATGSRTARRSTTTPPPTASTCASSPAPTRTSRGCARRWSGPTSLDDPRFTRLADRAAHNDEINGIVAEWTAAHSRCRRSRPRASRTTCRSRPRTPRPTCSPTRTSRPAATSSTVDDPVIGPVRQQAPYPRFVGRAGPGARRRARARRAHRRGARRRSALDADELDALRDAGVIG